MCISHTHLHIQTAATVVTIRQQLRSSTQQPTVTIVQCLQQGQRDNDTQLDNDTLNNLYLGTHTYILHTHLRIHTNNCYSSVNATTASYAVAHNATTHCDNSAVSAVGTT